MPLYSPCEYFIVLRLNSVVCPCSNNCIVTHVPNYPLASVPCTSVYCGSCVTVVIVVCQWSGPLSRLPPHVCSMYFSMSWESRYPVLTVLFGYVHSGRLFRCFYSVYFSISRSCVPVLAVLSDYVHSRLSRCFYSVYLSISRSCVPVLTVLSGYVHSRLSRCFYSVYFRFRGPVSLYWQCFLAMSIASYPDVSIPCILVFRDTVPVLAVLSDCVHSRLSRCFCPVYFSISRSCVPVLTVLSGYVHSRLSRCFGSVYFSTSRDMCPGCRPTDSAFWLYPSPAVLMSFCSVYINMSPES